MFVRRWSLRSKVMALLALRPTASDTVHVVVADRDLERGSVIDEGSVRVERMPSAFAPPGALRTTGDAIGRTLGSDLAEGEAVTRTRIGDAGGPVA